MVAFNPPANAVLNQQYEYHNKTYVFNGTGWSVYSTLLPALLQSTFNGDVTTAGVQSLTNKTVVNPALLAQTLPDGPTIAWNTNLGQTAYLTLNTNQGTRAILNPTNVKPGAVYTLIITQDAAGNHTITSWDSMFKVPAFSQATQGANAITVFWFIANSTGTQLIGALLSASTGAPAPAPAPGSDPVSYLFVNGEQGAYFDASDNTTIFGTDQVTLSTGDVGKWGDKSGRGNHLVAPLNDYPWYGTSESVSLTPYVQIWDVMETSQGGAGSTGFFFGISLDSIGWSGNNRILYSDVPTTDANAGYRVLMNSNNNLVLEAGTGASRVSVTATDIDAPLNTPRVFTAWHDGVAGTLNVRVNNGTVFSVAVGAVTPGWAAWRIGGDPAAAVAVPLASDVFAMVYRQSSGLTVTDRGTVRSWLATKGNIII